MTNWKTCLQYLQLFWLSILISHGDSANLTKFPPNFKFGVATSSYQIEGAWNTSGKSENIWDHGTHADPSVILDKSNGDVACDSYHKINEDVAMLKMLKVDGYRFSLSWSRLFPLGYATKMNPDGVRYYNDLINILILNGIEPWVTMYHWDLPQILQDLGGWTNPLLADIFLSYADKLFQLFGDRVKLWYTINEPANHCTKGYNSTDAPFLPEDAIGTYLCGHTMLRAHAKVYRLYQKKYKKSQKGKVGIVLDSSWYEPLNEISLDDNLAIEQFMQMYLGWFGHPIFSKNGDYPQIMRERIDKMSKIQDYPVSRLPIFTSEEIKEIRGSSDFLGINHYTSKLLTFSQNPPNLFVPTFMNDLNASLSFNPSWEHTGMPNFRVTPSGIRKVLKWIVKEYGSDLEISITENGYAGYKNDSHNDTRRVNYINEYLKETLQAITEGCNVVSYIYWSLMDNYEWSWGYTVHFGLFHVDFRSPNRTRTPKASAFVYQRIIQTRRVNDSYYPAKHVFSDGPKYNANGHLLVAICFVIIFINKS